MSTWVVLALLATGADVQPAPDVQADLHLDTPTQMYRKHLALDAPTGLEGGLAQLDAGGTNVAVEVLWPPRDAADPLAHAKALLALIETADGKLDHISVVHSSAVAREVVAAGRIAIVVSLEGAHGLGQGDWKVALDELERRGLSLLGLTWSFSNRFAGSSGDGGSGLTDEGRALVAECQRRGILIDLSHASRATTLEVCKASGVPVIASHSNAASLQPHARNLTDEEIRCIAATGGVVGVNFHASFVGGTRDLRAVADQADAIKRIGGAGAVALGSDFDGIITVPKGLEDSARLGALWDELRARGWTPEEVRGMKGENFLRAWQGAEAKAR